MPDLILHHYQTSPCSETVRLVLGYKQLPWHSVLIPAILFSNDALVLDQPIPLAGLIDGLAEDHVPVHTQQLLDLRVTVREHS